MQRDVVAARRKWFSDGGMVHLKRKIKTNCINTFNFKILSSKSLNIWIGAEIKDPKQEWWY